MAQRDLPLRHLDAKRLADIVGLAHGDLTAWREVASAEVGEQERRLALRHLRHAPAPPAVSSISFRPFMRTSPSRVIRRNPTATVGRLTPSQSASRALRSGSFSAHM